MNSQDVYENLQKKYKKPTTLDNHIIPQFLLRHFCNYNVSESIYLNKKTWEKFIPNFKKNKPIFPNKFIRDVIFNQLLEDKFGLIETQSAPIIQKIVDYSATKITQKFTNLKENSIIHTDVIDLSHFKFTHSEINLIVELYTSIFFRIIVARSSYENNLICRENLLNNIIQKTYYHLIDYDEYKKQHIIHSLNNFKKLLLQMNESHFIQIFNEYYYNNSEAKILIFNYLQRALLNQQVVLVSFDTSILPISDCIPFSWEHKVSYLPISKNSLLYIDYNINKETYHHIKNQPMEIYRQYREYIESNAYEFLYYDKNFAEIRADYSCYQYPKNGKKI